MKSKRFNGLGCGHADTVVLFCSVCVNRFHAETRPASVNSGPGFLILTNCLFLDKRMERAFFIERQSSRHFSTITLEMATKMDFSLKRISDTAFHRSGFSIWTWEEQYK
jgi:hypothetical protein